MTSSASIQPHPTVFLVIDMPIGAYLHYCVQLGNALVGTGQCAVRLVALFEDRSNPTVPDDERRLFAPGLEFQVLGPAGGSRLRRYRQFFTNWRRHLREIRRAGQGIVHLHTGTGWPWFDTALLLAYRVLRIPVVRTVHELTTAERVGAPTAIEQALGAVQLKLADVAIVHDQEQRLRLAPLLGTKDAAVVPHGNYLCFRSGAACEESVPDDSGAPLRVLFMGVKRHKGIEAFLEAMRRLLAAGEAVTATIIGRVNTGDEDLLDRIKELPNVRLEAGYVPNGEIERQYRRHDIVALPYIKGTTSGAVHLAYAFERPVIASDLPCFRDLVVEGKTGFVAAAGDAGALTEAFRRAIAARSRLPEMGTIGFQAVSQPRYSWERIAGETLVVYRQARARREGQAGQASYQSLGEDAASSPNSDAAASRTSVT
ncbi:MAG: glycosyltransferase family 4 protein [Nitrospiraceae bacterium]|nr:glycosyltransferase family 4 protein [Nitrospiraceae bacterium]